MEKFLFFFVHYGVPTILLAVVVLRRPASQFGLWTVTALTMAVGLFLYAWGQWPLVGSWYLRVVPVAVAFVALVVSARAARRGLPLFNGNRLATLGSAAIALLTAWIGYGVFNAFAGQRYDPPYADLEFPLRDGRFYVSSGGSSRVINNHMRSFASDQQYALDLSALGAAGGASRNVFSADNAAHHIFGMPVHAPCDGVVTEAEGGVADNAGPSMAVQPQDGRGNYLFLDCGAFVVALSHLKYATLRVTVGEIVQTGDRLAAVGNSGFSEEPHLHLQAAAPGKDNQLVGLPMRFDGRSYVRNDVIDLR